MAGKSLVKISDVSSLSISTAFTAFAATRAACFLSGMRVSSVTARWDHDCCAPRATPGAGSCLGTGRQPRRRNPGRAGRRPHSLLRQVTMN